MAESSPHERKALPERSTRGKRLKAQLAEEEDQADVEFWNQEFFAEEARDEDYVSEKEEEDVPDSDFFESESEEEDEEVQVRKEPKKKTLKAPGAPSSRPKVPKPPTAPKSAAKAAASSPATAAAQQAAAVAGGEVSQQLLFEATYEAPTLRKSTRQRVEVAQKEREERDQLAKATRRPQKQGEYRVLTQEELLAEAARTELENLASLKVLLAQEEETKRKANIKKQRYGGPMVKQRSRAIEVLLPPQPPAVSSIEQQLAAAATSAAAAAAGVHCDSAAAAASVAPVSLGTPGAWNAAAAAATPVAMNAVEPMDPNAVTMPTSSRAAAAAAAAAPMEVDTKASAALDLASGVVKAEPAAAPDPAAVGAFASQAAMMDLATIGAAAANGSFQQQQQQQASAAAVSGVQPPASTALAPVVAAGLKPITPDVTAGAAAAAVVASAASEPGAEQQAATPQQPAAATPAGTPEPQQQQQQWAQQQGQQEQQQQEQQQQQPAGPTLVKQELTTLQPFGMKAPRWLQPQRMGPLPAKPLCAVTGLVAKYKDPLTGHYYASAEAFRELRRRLGQPLPDAHKRRKSSTAADASAVGASGLDFAGQLGSGPVAGAGFPPGQEQLFMLLQQHVRQQQELAASGKGRAKTMLQPQPGVPDEVAALVVNISQMVHGGS